MAAISTLIWIWELGQSSNGDIFAIISKLKSVGATGVIVKAHDGANVWPQFSQAVGPLKAAGFKVGAWGYCYGDDVSGEARAALSALNLGADYYVIDAESEYEGKRAQAVQFGQLLRAGAPNAQIAYSSFPFASLHPDFPYREFSNFCNSVYPQCYWGEIGVSVQECLDRTYRELSPYGLPIVPVGQAFVGNYSPTRDDYQQFVADSQRLGFARICFWSYQAATDAIWADIAEISQDDPQAWAVPYLNALTKEGILRQPHLATELLTFAIACTIFNRTYSFGASDRPYDPANEIQIARNAGLVHDAHTPDEVYTWGAAFAMLARAARAEGGGYFKDWLTARGVITVDHSDTAAITLGELAVALCRIRNIPVSG